MINLVPVPPDIASVKMQTNTDGSIHFKLIQGKGTMPSFKNTISSGDLWRVISYIRSYNEKHVQVIDTKTGIAGTTCCRS